MGYCLLFINAHAQRYAIKVTTYLYKVPCKKVNLLNFECLKGFLHVLLSIFGDSHFIYTVHVLEDIFLRHYTTLIDLRI